MAITVAALTEAPSRTTAISSRVRALNSTPGRSEAGGVHTERTAAPIRMARTMASIQPRPSSRTSRLCRANAARLTAAHRARPGIREMPLRARIIRADCAREARGAILAAVTGAPPAVDKAAGAMTRNAVMKRSVLAVSLLLLAGCESAVDLPRTSAAAAEGCVLPAELPAPRMERVQPDEVVADRTILFHMLAVTWMPHTCRAGGDGQGELACDSDNRFGWTLHGLWPNADGPPYPRYCRPAERVKAATRSEEHTSELQSREKLVCRLLLEKKKN